MIFFSISNMCSHLKWHSKSYIFPLLRVLGKEKLCRRLYLETCSFVLIVCFDRSFFLSQGKCYIAFNIDPPSQWYWLSYFIGVLRHTPKNNLTAARIMVGGNWQYSGETHDHPQVSGGSSHAKPPSPKIELK